MKSKRAALTVLSPDSVGLESPRVSSRNFRPHAPNAAGVILEGDAETLASQVLEILESRTCVLGKGGAR
jgi:electron transfer flavoprotein beta subunit